VAVRSVDAQVSVPDGIATRVGDGTGVGVASVHGTMEADGELRAWGFVRAVAGVDGDCRGGILGRALPQPASAMVESTATR
jgi:hypothetical protein